jgi:hypothetical protein
MKLPEKGIKKRRGLNVVIPPEHFRKQGFPEPPGTQEHGSFHLLKEGDILSFIYIVVIFFNNIPEVRQTIGNQLLHKTSLNQPSIDNSFLQLKHLPAELRITTQAIHFFIVSSHRDRIIKGVVSPDHVHILNRVLNLPHNGSLTRIRTLGRYFNPPALAVRITLIQAAP